MSAPIRAPDFFLGHHHAVFGGTADSSRNVFPVPAPAGTRQPRRLRRALRRPAVNETIKPSIVGRDQRMTRLFAGTNAI
jgi:hypothetical protein